MLGCVVFICILFLVNGDIYFEFKYVYVILVFLYFICYCRGLGEFIKGRKFCIILVWVFVYLF